MKETKSTIRKIIDELESLLNSDEQGLEQPRPLLTEPCIAKTRSGDVVRVQRSCHQNYPFDYRNACSGPRWSVDENGRLSGIVEEFRDIVGVIRPLTEQEVLDWQFRGIEPDLSVGVVAEVFEYSDIGRKEAEAMGLVYLGMAKRESEADLDGTLCWFYGEKAWSPKHNKNIYPSSIYAYKPAT